MRSLSKLLFIAGVLVASLTPNSASAVSLFHSAYRRPAVPWRQSRSVDSALLKKQRYTTESSLRAVSYRAHGKELIQPYHSKAPKFGGGRTPIHLSSSPGRPIRPARLPRVRNITNHGV